MTLLANAAMGEFFNLVFTGAAFVAVVASVLQWYRFNACAYHADTGYWVILAIGNCHIFFGALGMLILPKERMIGILAAHALILLGMIIVLTGLLRLLSWKMHRHIKTP